MKKRRWLFPISRDPPEGGTCQVPFDGPPVWNPFPISRDPPEGGTSAMLMLSANMNYCFQFLGIPPKGEPYQMVRRWSLHDSGFPISRDPPEGGTNRAVLIE